MTDTQKKISSTYNRKEILSTSLTAFIISSLLFALLLILNDFLKPGSGSITRGDNYGQYLAFIESFMRVIKGEQSFWYSFSLYAGSDSVLTHLYYALSPFNLLYLLPFFSIITVTHIITVLKAGLSAAAFAWYSEKVLNQKKAAAVFFSLCYAFCSWAVIMSINYMWADSLYVFPVIITFLFLQSSEPCAKNYVKLTLCYAYLFITNFYMGYIVGIFTVLYYISMTLCKVTATTTSLKKIIFDAIKELSIFASSVILAAAIDAVLLLPAGYFLFRHLRGASESFTGLNASLPDILSALYACSASGLYSATPYIYCGLPVFILAPFYFFIKNIRFTQKLLAAIILIFYLCASLFLPLYAFLHAFDNPNYYPFRFSPCIVFLLISLAERVWQYRDSIRSKTLWLLATGLCAMYAFLVLLNSITGVTTVSNTYLVINSTFIFLWVLIFTTILKNNSDEPKQEKRLKYLPYATFVILTTELLISSSVALCSFAGKSSNDDSRINAEEFSIWYKNEQDSIKTINESDKDFFRIRVNNEKCFNGASFFGTNTLTSFASYEDLAQRTAFSNLGIGNAYHMLYDNSGTSIVDMLFSVKYTIDIPDEAENTPTINKNNLVLPIAYTVSADITSYSPGDNPFENINQLTSCMTGQDTEIFESVSDNYSIADTFNANIYNLGDLISYSIMTDKVSTGFVTYAIPRKGDQKPYVYFKPTNGTYYNSLSPYIRRPFPIGMNNSLTVASGSIYEADRNSYSTESSNKPNFNVDDYNYLTLYINTAGYSSYSVENVYFAYYNEDEVNNVYNQLKEGAMHITAFADDHIEGTVSATEDKPVLFTSIPYDKGWTAYVDGVPAKIYVTTNDAFCALALPPGEHCIVFDYVTPYSFSGSVITFLAAFLLVAIYFRRNNKSKTASYGGNSKKKDTETEYIK